MRRAEIGRETKETNIRVVLEIDGTGLCKIAESNMSDREAPICENGSGRAMYAIGSKDEDPETAAPPRLRQAARFESFSHSLRFFWRT